MHKYRYLLFDLDGTLVNTAAGILATVRYTQKMLYLPPLDDNVLQTFLGPPLKDSFRATYHMSEPEATKATGIFREYYATKGMLVCELYPGVEEVLRILKYQGYILYVATSKPTIFAQKILQRLGVAGPFKEIVGSNLDNTRNSKREVIQYIMSKCADSDKSQFLMIGDKSHDIIGAKVCGIDAIGVSYGFGTLQELYEGGPLKIIRKSEDIIEILS